MNRQYQIVLILNPAVNFEQAEAWADAVRALLGEHVALAIVEPVEQESDDE